MTALMERPTLGVVEQTIGAQINRRRTRLGMSASALASAAGVDRGSVSKIEKDGTGRDSTVGAITAALDRLETEIGIDLPAAAPSALAAEGLVEFSIAGNFGVSVIMKGPVKNMAEMEAAAARLVNQMQAERAARTVGEDNQS